MSRVVSIRVRNVVPNPETVSEAKKLLARDHNVLDVKNGFVVDGVVNVVVSSEGIVMNYDSDTYGATALANTVRDAIIAASTIRALRQMNFSVNVRRTERGYYVEAVR